ncbi:lytic murein transglycosylase [Agaribacterium haliotis]|uniref:lytic murein transglycosylase n=1 Tax=Agaribacterium haliotis TaxID=2013869 RepID=UPI001304432A|nr:lytic murein transglycosylase [Agaribacterium haliotis]
MKRTVMLLVLLLSSVGLQADGNQEFEDWLVALRAEASAKGISQNTIDLALSDVQYKKRVVKSDRKQAEFVESYHDYIEKRVSAQRVSMGQAYLVKHAEALAKVADAYGVPARFIVAIIGVETNYGSYKLQHRLFDVLCTLAFDKRRAAYFRKEVFAALEILDQGYGEHEQLRSSWAGALGTPQFMPSTYLQYAVDFDGDGKKDIWRDGLDLYASVANYLSRYGWNERQAWARKVIVPPAKQAQFKSEKADVVAPAKSCERYAKHFAAWRTLEQWDKQGLRRMTGAHLPNVDMPAALLISNPELSHGYLVYHNFCVLMRYNPSFKYALSVGVLADRIQ